MLAKLKKNPTQNSNSIKKHTEKLIKYKSKLNRQKLEFKNLNKKYKKLQPTKSSEYLKIRVEIIQLSTKIKTDTKRLKYTEKGSIDKKNLKNMIEDNKKFLVSLKD